LKITSQRWHSKRSACLNSMQKSLNACESSKMLPKPEAQTRDMTKSDVLIAGGGIVGTTLALALAQAGLTVALADPLLPSQMLDERFDGRVSALAFASVRMMRVLGLWERLEHAAQPIQDIVVNEGVPGRGPLPFSLHFDHREIGEPLGHI